MPPRPQSILEALLGGAGQGLQFAGQNLLPFRQQQLQNQQRADEAAATAGFREDQLAQGQSRIDLQTARDEEARQANFRRDLIANTALIEARNRPAKQFTKGQVEGQFLQENPNILERLFEADIDLTGRKSQPTAATPGATTPEGIPLDLLETITKEGLRGFKTDEEMEASLDFIRRALGLETAPRRQAPQQQPEELDFIDRIFKAGGSIGDIFTGGEQALQAAPSPRRTEGTIDQLERLFPPGTEEQGGVSQNVETWGRNRFGNQWDQATPEQKMRAADKAGIR